MKIWKKIILGFISVILIMMAVDFDALKNNIRFINKVDELEQSKRVELTQANKIAYTIQRIKSNLRELFLEIENLKYVDEITRARQVIENSFTMLTGSMNEYKDAVSLGYSLSEEQEDVEREKEELIMVDSLNTMVKNFTLSVKELLKLQDDFKFDEAELFFEDHTEPLSRKLQELTEVIVSDAEEEIEWAIIQMGIQVDRAIRLGVYFTILSVFLALGIGLYISRSISNPLNKLINGTKEIGKGNLETSVEVKTKDELQLLADSFNDMVKELKIKITSINNLNKELIEANSTKDTFFSIIAHDLKNPFNVIMGYADLLTTQYDSFDEDERMKFISEIDKSSKKTYELLENLLTWARSQSGKIQINKKTLNISSIINKSIESYAANAAQKSISIFNNASSEVSVKADEYTISVVINNIINNAIKFTPNGGQITISSHVDPNQVILSFKDTGVGMSQETIDNLILSEKMVSSRGTNDEKGSGLGLVLIKDFISKNEGQLWVESEPGKGSEFRFSLPR